MLSFTEQSWKLLIRSKATWAKSSRMLLAYRKQIIQKSVQNCSYYRSSYY